MSEKAVQIKEASLDYISDSDRSDVPTGYKKTEMGLIPEDWDLVAVGDLFSFKNGLNKAKRFFGYGTPIVNYMDVFQSPGLWPKDIVGRVDVDRNELKAYGVRKGDVFFTRTSETVEEVGVASVMLDDPTNAVFSGFVLRARPLDESLVDDYKKYCFTARYFRQQVTAKASYTTRALTNGRALSSTLLARPPKAEQRAIADALSDVDNQICALDTLIAKKRAIKQTAMQQILTGKTRLPGFQQEWEKKRLGEVCRITTGKKDVNEGNSNGQFPFFTCSRQYTFSDSYSYDTEAILIAGNGDVGNLHYYNGKFEAYQRTYVLSDFSVNVSYLWQQLSAYLVDALGLGKIGSSIPYIKKNHLMDFEFNYPLDIEEQTAIATVLSDIDAGIATLEQRRDKAHALKQGMMQQLLAGRIRLVKDK